MGLPAIDYVYRYANGSGFEDAPSGARLRLATSGGICEHPYFFEAALRRPKPIVDLLRGLMRIVQARFHVPAAMLSRVLAQADPVVTANDHRLRFEAFSACCSTYARVDLLPDAADGEPVGRGTTNVDFNAPLLAALARVRDGDTVTLAVGSQELRLGTRSETLVEKKVALPARWLKGFVEVQAYQARMTLVHELPGPEALRFLRSLPRAATHRHPSWVVRAGRGLRLSQRAAPGGVRVGGLERLRVLEDLVQHARGLRIHAEPEGPTSAWELVLDDARFHLVLSPEVWRGFSGEGQALESLSTDSWRGVLPRVRAALQWQSVLDAALLASDVELEPDVVRAALAALGARGLVGYDLSTAAYFHRELPFDLEKVELLQPRLRAARRLVEQGKVRVGSRAGQAVEVFVAGTDVEHHVRLGPSDASCTCPWHAKHRAARGPCKHILAARLVADQSSPRIP